MKLPLTAKSGLKETTTDTSLYSYGMGWVSEEVLACLPPHHPESGPCRCRRCGFCNSCPWFELLLSRDPCIHDLPYIAEYYLYIPVSWRQGYIDNISVIQKVCLHRSYIYSHAFLTNIK